MLFAFICIDKSDSQPLRSRLRAEHIAYMLAIKERTVFGGPLRDDDDRRSLGSIFAADFPSQADAEAFIENEPYNRGGVFARVIISRWRQMVPEREEGFLLRELAQERAKLTARVAQAEVAPSP